MQKKYWNLVVVVIVLIVAVIGTLFIFYKLLGEKEEVVTEFKGDLYVYEISWLEQSFSIDSDELKDNMRTIPFADERILNGWIDGTRFDLKFIIREKFLKNVTVSVFWQDRFTGPLGLTGRDVLYLYVCIPGGEKVSGIPLLQTPYYERLFQGDNLNSYSITVEVNNMPPTMEIVANNTDVARCKYWQTYDISDYNRWYDGEWTVYGEAYIGEKRLLRKVRDTIRNFIVSDVFTVEVSYNFCLMDNIECLGNADGYNGI